MRMTLDRRLAEALEGASLTLRARGDYEEALRYAKRLLALDPLNESAHRLLMRIYSRSGDRSAAIRQFKECERILAQELAVSPVEETVMLFDAVMGNGHHVARQLPPDAALPAFGLVETLPLIGRDSERSRLISSIDSRNAGGRVVVIEGEAGIGKTRLLEDLLESARSMAMTTIVARCYEGEADVA